MDTSADSPDCIVLNSPEDAEFQFADAMTIVSGEDIGADENDLK